MQTFSQLSPKNSRIGGHTNSELAKNSIKDSQMMSPESKRKQNSPHFDCGTNKD